MFHIYGIKCPITYASKFSKNRWMCFQIDISIHVCNQVENVPKDFSMF